MVKSFESDENKRNERRKTILEDTKCPQEQRWVFSRAPRWVKFSHFLNIRTLELVGFVAVNPKLFLDPKKPPALEGVVVLFVVATSDPHIPELS